MHSSIYVGPRHFMSQDESPPHGEIRLHQFTSRPYWSKERGREIATALFRAGNLTFNEFKAIQKQIALAPLPEPKTGHDILTLQWGPQPVDLVLVKGAGLVSAVQC